MNAELADFTIVLAFGIGFSIGYFICAAAKRALLDLPAPILTASQFRAMYQDMHRLDEITLEVKTQLDKLRTCRPN